MTSDHVVLSLSLDDSQPSLIHRDRTDPNEISTCDFSTSHMEEHRCHMWRNPIVKKKFSESFLDTVARCMFHTSFQGLHCPLCLTICGGVVWDRSHMLDSIPAYKCFELVTSKGWTVIRDNHTRESMCCKYWSKSLNSPCRCDRWHDVSIQHLECASTMTKKHVPHIWACKIKM